MYETTKEVYVGEECECPSAGNWFHLFIGCWGLFVMGGIAAAIVWSFIYILLSILGVL